MTRRKEGLEDGKVGTQGEGEGKAPHTLTKIHNQILQWHRPVLFLCLNVCTYSVIMPATARDSESGLVHRCCPSVRMSVCLSVAILKIDMTSLFSAECGPIRRPGEIHVMIVPHCRV